MLAASAAAAGSSVAAAVPATPAAGIPFASTAPSDPLDRAGLHASPQAEAHASGQVAARTQPRRRLAKKQSIVPSQRYDPAFWGKAGGRRRAGRKPRAAAPAAEVDAPKQQQTQADNKRDYEECRLLLLSLEESDLRERLEKSRWNPGHEGQRWDEMAGWTARGVGESVALDDNWLHEACLAFCVATASGGGRRQDAVVSDVLETVRRERALRGGPAALRDAARRSMHLQRLRDRVAVQHDAKTVGLCAKGNIAALREAVLVRACPERLRQDVAMEIIMSRQRLPGSDVEYEKYACSYVTSALARRHVSTPTGEQLSNEQVEHWGVVFAALPHDLRPTWPEDPVLLRVQGYLEIYGNLDVPKAKRGQEPEQAQLAADLRYVRAAKLRDARDRKGMLVRRQLSDVIIALNSPSICVLTSVQYLVLYSRSCGRSEMGAGVPRRLALV